MSAMMFCGYSGNDGDIDDDLGDIDCCYGPDADDDVDDTDLGSTAYNPCVERDS